MQAFNIHVSLNNNFRWSMKNQLIVLTMVFGLICSGDLFAQRQQAPPTAQQRMARYRQLLQRFDVNKNGRLDPEERAAIQRFQAQRNGGNTPQRPPIRPNQTGQSLQQRSDNPQRRNGMQFLPRKRESKLDKSALLRHFDTNGDGQLGAEERAAAIEAMQN